MIKPAAIFALVIALLLVLLSPGLVQARSGLTISASSVDVQFPTKLTFSLSAQSQADITDVRLHYTVDRQSYAQVTSEVYLELVPATVVTASWTWDMRKTGGLPPGVSLEYWWTVQDASGQKVATTPVRVPFDDNRYSWQSLTEGMVTIYWYQGRQSFAGEIMRATQLALARLTQDTGASLQKPVKMYVYAEARDLQGAMIFPQEWTGGATFTQYGVIAIGIAPNQLGWGKRAIAHELTHLVLHQMTFNPYTELPAWLDEGLAMYNEGALEAGFTQSLQKALAQNSLLSLRSLSSPFSAYAEASYLSYAQSYSLMEFLISRYGQSKMLELLRVFSEGGSYDKALVRVYGFDVDGLDSLWRDYVKKQYPKTKPSALIPQPVSFCWHLVDSPCHCEERSDVAIWVGGTSRPSQIASPSG